LAQGDFFTARSYFEQAYTISHELGNLNGKGITLSNLGWLTSILGDYPAAINYYEQALTILREIGNRSQEMYTRINLSATAGGQGNAQESLKWAQDALELSTKLGDQTGDAWAYFYLGYAYLLQKEFKEAARSFWRSIEIRSEMNNLVLVTEARAGLINVYLEMGDQVSAEIEAEQVLGHMEQNTLFEGAEEPLRIFLALYRVLEKKNDPRASVVLQNAFQLLNTQVSKLRSEDARRMYVENVPWRRAVQQIAKANGL
jgi:tetratricopeptide (TPR) repeat protein